MKRAKLTLKAVADAWEAAEWATLRARTKANYGFQLAILERWAVSIGNPPIADITTPQLMTFLARYNDRVSQRSSLKRVASALFSYALRAGLISTHPFGVAVRLRASRTGRKRPVTIWTAATVEAYTAAAQDVGLPGWAILLRTMWETSADSTDVITWKRGEHYADLPRPALTYVRGKTGVRVWTPISAKLAAEIGAGASAFLVLDDRGEPYPADKPNDDRRRTRHFDRIRRHVVANGGPFMLMDHLRHSATTHAVECGANIDHVPAISGHRDSKMLREIYVQFTPAMAEEVQRARGLI